MYNQAPGPARPPPPPPQQPQQQQQYYGAPGGPAAHAPAAPATTYQGYVKGLHGWNDPPPLLAAAAAAAPPSSARRGAAHAAAQAAASARIDVRAVLASVDSPVAHVLAGLTAAMDSIKAVVVTDPVQRKVLEDTDKRLEELLERLGQQAVPDALLAHLVVLATALNESDVASAKKTTMTLTLMSTEHHEDAHWIVGTKRLVDMFDKIVVAGGAGAGGTGAQSGDLPLSQQQPQQHFAGQQQFGGQQFAGQQQYSAGGRY